MKLVIGKPDYSWKHSAEIKNARILGRKKDRDIHLRVVSAKDMEKQRSALPVIRGFPSMCALDAKTATIWLWPAPDGEYELVVETPSTLGLPKRPVDVSI